MKLHPQQAPLYGDCIITVLLTEDDKVENDDVAFYLVFTGTTVQHCTSTRKLDSGTLETIAPGHDCCETVKVTLCATKQGHPILVVAEDNFQFIQDEAYDAAQFLASSAGNQQALNFARFLGRSRPPTEDENFLDEKMVLAFRHLKLPAEWNVLGADHNLSVHVPRETLIHFAVRLGLLRLTWFLLQQPGGRIALCVSNSEGATPVSLALERGYQKLHQLLTEEEAREPDSWSTLSHTVHSGEHCVKHHRGRNIYTFTIEAKEGSRSSMEDDINQLCKYIESHQHMNASKCPPPAQRTTRETCGVGAGATGADHAVGEVMTEADPLSPLELDAIQIMVSTCPKEDGCGEEKEPVGLQKDSSLEDAENASSSGKSRNLAGLCKEEEEEFQFVVDSGAVLEKNNGTLNPVAGFQSAVGPPSSGDSKEETGMTSPDAALEQGSLCERDNFQQEAQTTESVAEPPVSCQDCDAGMGQTECKSCTGSEDAVVAAVVQQSVENGGSDGGSSGPASMETLSASGTAPTDLATSSPVVIGGDTSSQTESSPPGHAADQPGYAYVDTDQKVRADTPAGCTKEDSAKGSEDFEPEEHSEASCPGTEAMGVNTASVLETLPKLEPVLNADIDGKVEVGLKNLDVSCGVQGAGDSMESDRSDQRWFSAPEASSDSNKIREAVTEVPGEQETFEPLPLGTEHANCTSGGSVDSPSLDQGAQKEERGPSSDSDANSASASEPVPVSRKEPLCKQAEVTGIACEPDRFSKSAQEFIAVASALLVEEAIQQAQLMVAQDSNTRAASVGQEASLHLQHVTQASPGGEGTECVQDNLMGTPSDVHNADSKQNQEVVGEQPVVAEQGSPACDELASGPLPPADPPGKNIQNNLSPQLPGKEVAPTPVAVEQFPSGCQGEELPGSASNARLEIQGEASSLAAGEDAKVGTVAGVLQGPGLAEDASICAVKAPSPEAVLNQELDPSTDVHAVPPLSGVSSLMETPLLPVIVSLPGEEVESIPSRILLQPIAEELLCDIQSAQPDVWDQPSEDQKEASDIKAASPILPASPAVADLLEKVDVKDSDNVTEAILLDNTEKPAENASGAISVEQAHDPFMSLAGNPSEIPPAVELTSDAQRIVDVSSVPNGEADLSLQPSGLMERTASPGVMKLPPVPDSRDMKTEEEVDCLKGLADDATSDETINRESWSPVEPSPDPPLLKLKHSCNVTGKDNYLDDNLSSDCTSSQGILKRESGSESDLFPLPGDGMDEMDFGKQPEEEQSAGDSTSCSSSAEDTISLERNSSLGSDTSLPQALSRPKDQYSLDGSGFSLVTAEGQHCDPTISGELEEELDRITEVPAHSSVLRNSMRPLSPFRRHSWGPGKNASSEAEINHRSSMRVLGDVVRKPPTHRRSLSWCPSGVQCTAMSADLNGRSYSLEGLAGEADGGKKPSSLTAAPLNAKDLQQSPLANDERGSLVSLTEEELESEQGERTDFSYQIIRQRTQQRSISFYTTPVIPPLTKSMSLMTIAQTGADSNRHFNGSAINSSLTQSISEEESCHFLPPSPSRKDLEGKSGTKVSRTFSYLKNKMSSSKKSKEKEKDKEKMKEKDKDSKEKDKDKKTVSGHLFSTILTVGAINCQHCTKPFKNMDCAACSACGIIVHKCCKESVTSCATVRMKKGGFQPHDSSSLPAVVMRNKSSQPRERPRSAILAPDESTVTSLFNSRRSQQNMSLSKSVSIQNIAGVGNDENILHTLKFLSQSTDSLNKINRVNESTESLTDEGADMNEGQLMGDFEMDSKQLEAESWSQVVDSKFLRQQKKDVVKRQDVIYELMQTEMHHIRTLKIMSDVYSRGMVQELQYEQQMVEKIFPCLDNLLNIHSQFFQRILERKKESLADRSDKNFVIQKIGDILVNQFSGENAERMKKTYGKFCGHQNEAVNYFKDLHSKDKRFQAFVKKKMSSSVVRRLGIPECILLVTQRITKYPVLLQRILQYTKENDIEHQDLVQSLNQVKEVITAVDSKVSNYEKKMRLDEIYTRTDSKSIMRMKSGQMFAREDLRRRKFVRDGPVSLKNAAGRLKEVQAVLLLDVLIFLQEKDQKYAFASLDQKSTVISLKKLIVREVAHEEKGLFLISMGGKDPEMVEVHASSKEERNSWIQVIQDTINTMDKEEDEGIPSESEEEKRVLDTKARELKEQLQQKDQQILNLLEEKEKIFRLMTNCSGPEDSLGSRTLFRANTDEALKGESVMKSVITEVEFLQAMVSQSLGSTLGQQIGSLASEQEVVGPISLPRRAETFGGFDSHQMNVCKGGERDEGEDAQDLRRTESDSVLKKGGTANLMFILKRNNEQVLQCITHLHSLLSKLQAVVVQQDTYIEDQKVLLVERALSRSSFRPSSLIEQERQRSLEKQRQELANLQKQQIQHQEEKRRSEREWEARENVLAEREAQLAQLDEQIQKSLCGLEKRREELQKMKATYQLDLEHLRAAQKQLDKEKEQIKRDMEQIPHLQTEPGLCLLSIQHTKKNRTPALPVSEDSSSRPLSSSLSKQGPSDTELSIPPKRNSLSRTHKEKSSFTLLGTSTSNQTSKPAEGHNRLFGLAKPKEKKEKRKKGKGSRTHAQDSHSPEAAPESEEIFC